MTKFKYKDKVKVVSGFYRGQSGKILAYRLASTGTWTYSHKYYVTIEKDYEEWILEEDLRLVK